MFFLSPSLARRSLFVLLLAAAAAPLSGCHFADGDCAPAWPGGRTMHFVISEARAAEIVAGEADGGTGPTCRDECYTVLPPGGASVGGCSLDGSADGGVGLTCVFWAPACV